MEKREKGKRHMFAYQLAECLLVVLCVSLSYMTAAKLLYHTVFPFGILSGFLLYTMISALSVLCFGANRYFCIKERAMPEIFTCMFVIVVSMNLVFVALLYFSHVLRLSVYFFVIVDVLQIGLLSILKVYFSGFKQAVLSKRKALVIAKPENKETIMKAVLSADMENICFMDFRDERLEKLIAEADVIYMAGGLPKKYKSNIVSGCLLLEKDIYLVPETYEISLRKSRLTQIGDVPVFNIEPYKLSNSQNLLKRLIDIVGALTGILLTSPLTALFAMLIKCEDGGSVFYSQTRSGRSGREFEVIKFRSMRQDAEKSTGAVFAKAKDSRITRVGNFMRSTRIDEIPQFINVLKGEMSLVGPRPERPVFVEKFCKEIPEYKNRLAVKPGITGLAQVLGNYTTTAVNKARFDMVYIQEYSLMLDIKILFKTIKVVFTKEQAAGFGSGGAAKVGNWDSEAEVGGQKLGVEGRGSEARFARSALRISEVEGGWWIQETASFVPTVGTEDLDLKADSGLEKRMPRAADYKADFNADFKSDFANFMSSANRKNKRIGWQRILKTVLVAGCCFVVISASLMFRYVSFAAEAFRTPTVAAITASGELLATGEVAEGGTMADAGAGNAAGSGGAVNGSFHTNDSAEARGSGLAAGKITDASSEKSMQEAGGNQDLGTLNLASGVWKTVRQEHNSTATAGAASSKDVNKVTSDSNIALSEENIQNAIEKVTFKDKIDAIIMLVTRLSTDDIMLLEEMSREGFTVEEKTKAKEMMYGYYDDAEVETIRQLYVEYVR